MSKSIRSNGRFPSAFLPVLPSRPACAHRDQASSSSAAEERPELLLPLGAMPCTLGKLRQICEAEHRPG